MCFFSVLTRPSMYLRALAAVGSCAGTPQRSRPVSTTPVIPGLFDVLQPPPGSWVLRTYRAALLTTSSQVFLSEPTFGAWADVNDRPETARAARELTSTYFMGLSESEKRTAFARTQIKCRLPL